MGNHKSSPKARTHETDSDRLWCCFGWHVLIVRKQDKQGERKPITVSGGASQGTDRSTQKEEARSTYAIQERLHSGDIHSLTSGQLLKRTEKRRKGRRLPWRLVEGSPRR